VRTLFIFCCLINEAFFGAIVRFPFLGPRAEGLFKDWLVSFLFIFLPRILKLFVLPVPPDVPSHRRRKSA
jgi:hypothetical protein